MIDQVKETVKYLENRGFNHPDLGIILGTGLSALTNHIEILEEISYEDIPNFPIATVEFHKGKLIYGKLEGKSIVAMSGRFHFYEGYTMQEVVFPVRVMKYLGIKKLLISNAAGNMNLNWKKGELMLIDDHINLQPDNPLRGKNTGTFGPIFTDMSQPYDAEMNALMEQVAAKDQIPLNKGVYVAVAGPNLETRAEYRYLRNIGADVVGMSTVPEVIAANQMGLPVSAVSVLTDDCDPDHLEPVNIDDIIATAASAEKHLVALFKEVVQNL
ncbi:purine-nucleoside phosphorylase [Marinoscillum sp.]|uniref:purine-nucleoside phosphorylase n=1 Tax=Marinoscillum sp. TaxID=2024838 RepID=UPI003BAC7D3F